MSWSGFSNGAAPAGPGLAERLAERWRLWRHRRRWLAELADVAAVDRLDDLLSDTALTRAELGFLADAPADAGRQFEEMAAMEGVDLHTLPPEVLREAVWKCIRCECRAPCKRWLRTGVWEHEGDSRCPNAELLRQ